jgi:hypothetical protein
MNPLIEKALQTPLKIRKPNVSKDLAELSVEWLKGNISNTQVAMAINVTGGNVYSSLCSGLKEAYNIGLIK